MKKGNKKWQNYLEAASRELEIVAYHADQLREAVKDHSHDSNEAPSIPIQAHFEGVVVSIMAAMDKVVEAVISAWKLPPVDQKDRVKNALEPLALRVPKLKDWLGEEIGRDLRRIRTRIVHYTYRKTPYEEGWFVESAGTKFSGSRELIAYTKSAVEHGKCLQELLPRIKEEIAKGNTPRAEIIGGKD